MPAAAFRRVVGRGCAGSIAEGRLWTEPAIRLPHTGWSLAVICAAKNSENSEKSPDWRGAEMARGHRHPQYDWDRVSWHDPVSNFNGCFAADSLQKQQMRNFQINAGSCPIAARRGGFGNALRVCYYGNREMRGRARDFFRIRGWRLTNTSM
jgi:hypothetical protein